MGCVTDARWPVVLDDRAFQPIPQSWIDAGVDRGTRGKRLYAVSAALPENGTSLHVRYGHPASGAVLLTKTCAEDNPTGEGKVPAGLAEGTGWPRCKTPHPDVEPVEPLRDPEWTHLWGLWADRLGIDGHCGRGGKRNAVTDGGDASERHSRGGVR